MKIEGSRHIAAPVDVVWVKLNDTQVLKGCIAGCEQLTPAGDAEFTLLIKAKIGPLAATFSGRLALRNVVESRSYTLVYDGQGGVAGFAHGTADVTLEPRDGGTEIRYVVDTQVGGRIAQLAQRLVDGVAHKIVDDFFARFEAAVARST